MTTEPHTPPMEASNEAEPAQLDIARAQGDTYAQALRAMDEESGAVTQRAGDYLVAFVQENAEGMYELADGRLVWREGDCDCSPPPCRSCGIPTCNTTAPTPGWRRGPLRRLTGRSEHVSRAGASCILNGPRDMTTARSANAGSRTPGRCDHVHIRPAPGPRAGRRPRNHSRAAPGAGRRKTWR